MILPFRIAITMLALITGALTSYTVFAQTDLYDRLDGKGESKKRVDVIEWEGNLEVHVYPHAGLKGLAAKLDDRTQGKRVMVIGYRFFNKTEKGMRPLIRRAILGVPFTKDLKAFIDPTEKEFDKLALSNHTLPKPWAPYQLDPAPAQWYPDGDERNEAVESPRLTETQPVPQLPQSAPVKNRAPASAPNAPATEQSHDFNDREGSLNNYSW